MNASSRRSMIRLTSFASAAVLVLVASTAAACRERDAYRRRLQYVYQRALQDTADYVSDIGFALDKSVFAGTPARMASLAGELRSDALGAKAALSALPLEGFDLGGTFKFLSQVGDYAAALGRRMETDGEPLAAGDRETLEKLRDCAAALGAQVDGAQARAAAGTLSFEEIAAEGLAAMDGGDAAAAPGDGYLDSQESASGYPTLIYDGPFSDHLLDRSPVLTREAPAIPRGEARAVAARAALCPPDALEPGGDEQSRMPCYTFTSGETSVAVTQSGGFVAYMADGRAVGIPAVSAQAAREAALGYLGYLGLPGLRETYYETQGNILTINYAAAEDDTVCYPDLVKVGVALDNGGIVFFDARGYIMNHRARGLPAPKLTATEARASVSAALDVTRCRTAVIPTPGGGEAFCYEFYGAGAAGRELLVYVDAATGAEADSLELIRTGDGVLTK